MALMVAMESTNIWLKHGPTETLAVIKKITGIFTDTN